MLRVVLVVAGLASAFPAMAGEMTASEAKHFVVEKLFSYTCFDGTRGTARVHLRGSMMQPCFYLERTNDNSFRGSIAGLSFAYCDFTHYQGAAQAGHGEQPLSLTADR